MGSGRWTGSPSPEPGDDPACERRPPMSSAYDNGRSSNQGLWITLGVVGGLFLVCGGLILAFVVGGYFLARHTAQNIAQGIEEIGVEVGSGAVAEEFLDEIGAGHLDSAYEELTTRG